MAPAAAVLQNPFPSHSPGPSSPEQLLTQVGALGGPQSSHQHRVCSQHVISQVVRQTFLPGIRQTFPWGSVREAGSARARIQQELPLPPAWLCQASPAKPAQQSQPSTATLCGRGATDTTPAHSSHRHTGIPWECSLLCRPHPCRWHWQRCPHARALLWGVSAGSALKIQLFHPQPPQQVSYLAYQPSHKGIQVPQLTGLCQTLKWPLQKPRFQGMWADKNI